MAYCLVQDWVEPETERSRVNYDAITARLLPLAGAARGFIATPLDGPATASGSSSSGSRRRTATRSCATTSCRP